MLPHVHRCGNWGSELVSYLPEVTWILSSNAKLESRSLCDPGHTYFTAMEDRRLISFILPDGLFIPKSLVFMLWCQSHKLRSLAFFSPLCFSVAQSCPTLCNPMDCSVPDFPVLHHLPEFAQIHVHWIRDAIQPSHPLSPPSPSCSQSFPASESFPMSQLFISCGQSIRASVSASVLPMNIQSWFPLKLTGLISLLAKGLSRVFSSTTVWNHQFFGTQPSLHLQLSHPYTLLFVVVRSLSCVQLFTTPWTAAH